MEGSCRSDTCRAWRSHAYDRGSLITYGARCKSSAGQSTRMRCCDRGSAVDDSWEGRLEKGCATDDGKCDEPAWFFAVSAFCSV